MSTDAVTQKVAALSLEATSPPTRAAPAPAPAPQPSALPVKPEPAPTPLLSQLQQSLQSSQQPPQQTQQQLQQPQLALEGAGRRGAPASLPVSAPAAVLAAAASVPISVPSKGACAVAHSTPSGGAGLKRTARAPDALAFAGTAVPVPVPGGAAAGSAPAARAAAKWADVPLTVPGKGAVSSVGAVGAVGAVAAGKAGGDDGVAPFVSKTYDLVNDPTTQHLVGWSAEHKCLAFVVYDPVEFAAAVLPRYFKHSNFCSFVHQLNIYGFHKIESSEGYCFQHPNFRINSPHLLRNIQRRKSSHRKGAQADLAGGSTSPTGHASPASPTAAAAAAAAAAAGAQHHHAPPARHAAAQSPLQSPSQISPVVQLAMSAAFAQQQQQAQQQLQQKQQQQLQQKQQQQQHQQQQLVKEGRGGPHGDVLPWGSVGSPPLGGPLGAFETKQSSSSSSSASTPAAEDALAAGAVAAPAGAGAAALDAGCSPETATILQTLRASLPRNTEPAEVYKVLLDEIIKLQRQNGDTQNTIKHLRGVLMESKTREQQLQQRLQSISQYIHDCNVANPATPIPHDLVLLSQPPPQPFPAQQPPHYALASHHPPPAPSGSGPQQQQQLHQVGSGTHLAQGTTVAATAAGVHAQQQQQQQQGDMGGGVGFGEVLAPALEAPVAIKQEGGVDAGDGLPGAHAALDGPGWAQAFPADLMHPDDDGGTSLFVQPDAAAFADAHYGAADAARGPAGAGDLPDPGPVLLGPAALQQWNIADADDYWSAVSMR